MKVLYDYQAFTYQKFGGVSKQACIFLKNMPEDVEYEIALTESDNMNLREYGLMANIKPCKHNYESFLKGISFPWKHKLYRGLEELGIYNTPTVVGKRYSIEKLKEGKFDVFHPTFFDPYFVPFLNGKPFVLTVHDCIYEVLKEEGTIKDNIQIHQREKLCPLASHIVVASENTKKDLMKYYDIPSEKITVIYRVAPESRERRSLPNIIGRPYILYIGVRGLHKGWAEMVTQISDFIRNNDIILVCSGANFTKDELDLLQRLGISNKVISKLASSDEICSLYNNAEVFIYPSLYEGFGIPIVEGFAMGCPVLLNRRSSLPEIGGDAAAYFNLDDKHSLSEVLEKVVLTPSVQASMVQNGYERVRIFTPQNAVAKYCKVYKNVYSQCF